MSEREGRSVPEMARLCSEGRHWEAIAGLQGGGTVESLGYHRVVETRIVADLLAEPEVKTRVPRITDRFLSDFTSFDLSGSEGYLASLIDGQLSLDKVLLISTLGRFKTLLALARLREKGVLTLTS